MNLNTLVLQMQATKDAEDLDDLMGHALTFADEWVPKPSELLYSQTLTPEERLDLCQLFIKFAKRTAGMDPTTPRNPYEAKVIT